VEQKASGIILTKLLHHAFRTAKRVRTETAIANNAVSVSFAAVEMAKKVLGSLTAGPSSWGAGEMSEAAARHLMATCGGSSWPNRTMPGPCRSPRSPESPWA